MVCIKSKAQKIDGRGESEINTLETHNGEFEICTLFFEMPNIDESSINTRQGRHLCLHSKHLVRGFAQKIYKSKCVPSGC